MSKTTPTSYASNNVNARTSNATAPITHLPPEILAMIFEASISPGRNDSVKHVRLMMVCRHWRLVVMEFPELWTSLLLRDVRVTATMLERSRESPLVVEADLSTTGHGRDADAAVGLALSHLSRIRVLHISSTGRSLLRLFLALKQSAPLLESLRFVNPDPRLGAIALPSGLFKGDAPRLHDLSIRAFTVPWNSPLLCNLTYLKIDKCYPGPNPVEFRHILARCPALDTLLLSDSPADVGDISENWDNWEQQCRSQAPVTLAKLSRLELKDNVRVLDIMTHSLSLPPTTAVVLFCMYPGTNPIALHPIFANLATNRVGGLSIIRLSIESSFSLRCRAWTSDDSGNPSLDLSLRQRDFSFLQTLRPDFVVGICKGLSLAILVALKISSEYYWDCEAWTALFSYTPKLQVLAVRTTIVEGLISPLLPILAKATEESPRYDIPLPELRELALHCVDFTHKSAQLKQCLMLRRDSGAGLETLKLFNCAGLSEDDVEGLTPSVCSLERDNWDGIVRDDGWQWDTWEMGGDDQ